MPPAYAAEFDVVVDADVMDLESAKQAVEAAIAVV